MKMCPECKDYHCSKCGLRLAGGLCHGPPCSCGQKKAS